MVQDHTLVISLSYLSFWIVWLTARASPRATPPSGPISFWSRLHLEMHTELMGDTESYCTRFKWHWATILMGQPLYVFPISQALPCFYMRSCKEWLDLIPEGEQQCSNKNRMAVIKPHVCHGFPRLNGMALKILLGIWIVDSWIHKIVEKPRA